MVVSKSDEFEKEEIQLARLAKAMAHPARVRILRTLVCRDLCNCCDIVEELPLAQSTVSQHLKALKEAKLIHGEVDGIKSSYRVNYEVLSLLINIFDEFSAFLKQCKGDGKWKTRKT